ncbi:MAG: post-transcriptional regulator [Bacilli bacterium]|jgi:aspartate carbamoyltransferase regulatory subunit|nr:post-transcriptional regulator [Bacilli bacterium]
MDIKFNSITELYTRLQPALNSKRKELLRDNYHYIKNEDIWNYLKDNKWVQDRNLSLAEMVDDVLSCQNEAIDKYVKERLKKQDRKAYFNDLEGLL